MGMGVEFWVTSIIVTATPGTGVVFTIAAGLTRGPRLGLLAPAAEGEMNQEEHQPRKDPLARAVAADKRLSDGQVNHDQP